MPEYFIKYTEEQDGRRKLTEAQKEKIRERYNLGGVSWADLAKEYRVSKTLIGIIVNPKRAKSVRDRIKKHWRDYQQKGEEWANTQRKTRAKKRRMGLVVYKKPVLDDCH